MNMMSDEIVVLYLSRQNLIDHAVRLFRKPDFNSRDIEDIINFMWFEQDHQPHISDAVATWLYLSDKIDYELTIPGSNIVVEPEVQMKSAMLEVYDKYDVINQYQNEVFSVDVYSEALRDYLLDNTEVNERDLSILKSIDKNGERFSFFLEV